MLGRETVNLNDIPHFLVGGETGSGKSVLLKNVIFQTAMKGADVRIACMKGGVDFPHTWQKKFKLVKDKEGVLETLITLTDELKNRQKLFLSAGCENLGEYNKQSGGNELKRLIFAFDEITDVLDKTGLSKTDKEFVEKIESHLSKLARLGRAFGINLFLSTQRSSADVLSGQISNNIGLRVCGRANSVLSKIILDDTVASKQIPKNAKGRFITNTGTIFQGYWFDAKCYFNND
jgi:S-DNA-T family DNA segregation ATPase FtsK/SpoIIIE